MSAPKPRLDYIDWMRGLACLTMFQTHCYNAWLAPAEREGEVYRLSQLIGTLPAPLFLFLAGVSMALVMDRLESKGLPGTQVARATAKRGLEIFGLGMLFRVQEFVLGFGWAPWTDLLRVDILNTIGLSMVFASSVALVRGSTRRIIFGAAAAAAIALVTPPLWTTWNPTFLPWWLSSYINGGHFEQVPKPWLFPLFPWTGFVFAGVGIGLIVMRATRAGHERRIFLLLGGAGAVLAALALWLDSLTVQLYAIYDFWHTSPNFFLLRVGVLLMILPLSYGWCTVKPGKVFSPMIQLGKTSLLVYWVHIEFVYGRFSIMPKGASSFELASFGLLIIFVAMVLLSLARTRLKGRGAETWNFLLQRLGVARA